LIELPQIRRQHADLGNRRRQQRQGDTGQRGGTGLISDN
jgi:hypothetical protein